MEQTLSCQQVIKDNKGQQLYYKHKHQGKELPYLKYRTEPLKIDADTALVHLVHGKGDHLQRGFHISLNFKNLSPHWRTVQRGQFFKSQLKTIPQSSWIVWSGHHDGPFTAIMFILISGKKLP